MPTLYGTLLQPRSADECEVTRHATVHVAPDGKIAEVAVGAREYAQATVWTGPGLGRCRRGLPIGYLQDSCGRQSCYCTWNVRDSLAPAEPVAQQEGRTEKGHNREHHQHSGSSCSGTPDTLGKLSPPRRRRGLDDLRLLLLQAGAKVLHFFPEFRRLVVALVQIVL